MTPAQARAMYRRQISAHGELVALRREALDPAPEASGLRARVTGFSPEELASGIDQGARKVILLAEDLEAAIAAGNWPEPAAGFPAILKDDTLVVRGAPVNVERVDDSTRRVSGELIAYELTVIG
ncbi:hypothetical protein [Hansschlegelia sp.]|uniref:hypothetical protein n=1 Tax=Hansschlegelia sp. TaxID=2041892 RepID=UPI002CF83982|nr:hypothetical protein [Hansschlegelia sp.]HVI28852.1 hypothetical protein [Hansschlegelia sp.]